MKKLLAITAFVTASVAASGAMAQSLEDRIRTLEESMLMGAPGTGFDIQLSGFAHGGFFIQDADPTEAGEDFAGTDVKMGSAGINFDATSVLDNGIEISGRVELEGFTTGDQINETYMTLSGGFGRFILGARNGPLDQMHIGYPWAKLNGADGADYRYTAATAVQAGTGTDIAGDANKIVYFTPRFSGFQFGISYAPDNEDTNGRTNGGGARDTNNDAVENIVEVSGNFTRVFGDVGIGASAGWQSGSSNVTHSDNVGVATDPTYWRIGGNVSMQNFTVGGAYSRGEGLGTDRDGKGGSVLRTHTFDNGTAETADDDVMTPFDLSNRIEQTAWSVGALYQTGPWGVGIGYFQAEGSGYPGSFTNADGVVNDATAMATGIASVDAETSTVGITAFYEAGPGVTVAADIAFHEDDDGLGTPYSTVEAVGGGIILGIDF